MCDLHIIACPFGGTPPPARHFLACPPCILWQGILARHLWSCRALLTGSWGLLRASWSLLGRSWGPLGAPWGALGGVLGPLGRLLGRDKLMQNITSTTNDFMIEKGGASPTFLGGVLGAKNRPKSDPRRVQNEDDFQEPKKSSSRASWSRLGPILGHFGGHLGVQICAPVHAG